MILTSIAYLDKPKLIWPQKGSKKHKNKISELVNLMCYNEQKTKFRLFTNSSELTIENIQ